MATAIGYALFQIGAPLWAVNIATGGAALTAGLTALAGSSLGQAAIGLGLSYVGTSLINQQTGGAKPSDGQQQIRQAISARRKSYGLVRVSGSIWWFDTDPAQADRLYIGLVLNHGQIGEIVRFHIDDNPVEVDAGTSAVQTAPYDGSLSGGDFEEQVYLYSRLGLAVETAYSQIASIFGISDCRGDGMATLLGVFDSFEQAELQLQTYPNGAPQIRVTEKASLCFDPRQASHVQTDPTTWTWSDNAGAGLLNFAMDADGYGLPYELIERNLAGWKTAMDICDERVALAEGGSTRRYRTALSYYLTDDPKNIAQQFLDCMDGRMWVKGDGSIGITAGKFVAPTVTIRNEDIVGFSDVTCGQDPVTSIAGVRAHFMSPDDDFREHEAEPWPTGTEVAALTEERVTALDLTRVPSHNQSRRLQKREYKRATAPWRGTWVTNLAGLRAMDEQFIRLEHDEFNIADSFEVKGFSLDLSSLTCTLDLFAVDATIDDFDAATEEMPEDTRLIFGYASGSITTDSDGTFDPLALSGGKVDQVCVVLVHNSTGATIKSSVTGWERITGAGIVSSNSVAAFVRVLDGTETAIQFATGAVGIAVLLFDGMVDGYRTEGAAAQVTTSAPTAVVHAVRAQPYAVIEWMASASSGGLLSQSSLLDPDGNDATEASGELGTRAFRVTTFGYPEDPVALTASMNNVGTNGFLSFILRPL